jgi:hypothetical protein
VPNVSRKCQGSANPDPPRRAVRLRAG